MGVVVERALVEDVAEDAVDSVEVCTAISNKCLEGFGKNLSLFANFSAFKTLIHEPSLASLIQKDLDAKIPFSFDVTNGKNGFFNCLQIAETHLEDGQYMLVSSSDLDPGNDGLLAKSCAVLLRKDAAEGFSYPKIRRFAKAVQYRFHDEAGNKLYSITEPGTEGEGEPDLELDLGPGPRCVVTNYSRLALATPPRTLLDLNTLYEKEIFTVGPVLAFEEITADSVFVFVNSDNSYYLSTYEF